MGVEVKNFQNADEVRELPKTRMNVVNLEYGSMMHVVFEPGWKWSECVKPSAETDSCEVPHLCYVISGAMEIIMDDGESRIINAGDVVSIPPGHDAVVIGDEPCTMFDFRGAEDYGK